MLWNDIVYVLLLLLSIAIGPFYRRIEGSRMKQWIATLLGFALVICVSGLSILHPIITVFVNSVIITNLSWKKCHLVSLYFSFFYLLVIFRLGDYFGLPSPPTHTNLVVMILTLKLSGLAFEINSAATAPANDAEGANSDALKKINFMDVIHYSFGYMGVLTDMDNKFRYEKCTCFLFLLITALTSTSTLSPCLDPLLMSTFRELCSSCEKQSDTIRYKPVNLLTLLKKILLEAFKAKYTQTVAFEEHCFLYKFFYMYPAFTGFRLRMFIGMALAECVCQMSGLGAYPVCCHSTPGLGPRDYKTIEKLSFDREKVKREKQDFETVHNMNIWEVELSPFVRHTMKMWNACIQYWMAVCIYKRFPYKSLRTVVTMILSALWHGYAAGYYFCICQVPLYLPFEDICIKFYNQCEENGIGRKIWGFFLWWAKLTCMAYLGVPFQLLRFQEIIHFYKSLYFSGHILGLVAYLILRILKTQFLKQHQMDKRK